MGGWTTLIDLAPRTGDEIAVNPNLSAQLSTGRGMNQQEGVELGHTWLQLCQRGRVSCGPARTDWRINASSSGSLTLRSLRMSGSRSHCRFADTETKLNDSIPSRWQAHRAICSVMACTSTPRRGGADFLPVYHSTQTTSSTQA